MFAYASGFEIDVRGEPLPRAIVQVIVKIKKTV